MKIISNTSVFYLDKTVPKGSIAVECGKLMLRNGYKVKIFNSINFKKSHHYNPFAYIHSEKDILKLVTTLIANTKGDGKSGDDFWQKAETLLYTALIGYIHYEAPEEEQNFATLIEFINAMEVREDDETFENNVILTRTERLMMSNRPKDPKTARNKNVLVVGGSGSGKTRFFIKPNLMQLHSSYVVTDPNGYTIRG